MSSPIARIAYLVFLGGCSLNSSPSFAIDMAVDSPSGSCKNDGLCAVLVSGQSATPEVTVPQRYDPFGALVDAVEPPHTLRLRLENDVPASFTVARRALDLFAVGQSLSIRACTTNAGPNSVTTFVMRDTLGKLLYVSSGIGWDALYLTADGAPNSSYVACVPHELKMSLVDTGCCASHNDCYDIVPMGLRVDTPSASFTATASDVPYALELEAASFALAVHGVHKYNPSGQCSDAVDHLVAYELFATP